MDVSEVHAYPFIFEQCCFWLRVNIVIFSALLTLVPSTVNVAGFVDNNLIDMLVANNIVKWLQNVATRYPKRPLQAEGKWLLGRPRFNGFITLVLRGFIVYIK